MPTALMRSMVITVVGLLAVCTSARGSILLFQANLSGLQVVPPNASPAFGTMDITVDDVSGLLTVTAGSYQGLLGSATATGLHFAPAGTNGAQVFPLTLDSPGTTTGTISGGGSLTPAQVADTVAGNLYVRLSSQVFPGGELRGQFAAVAVPEPASVIVWALLAMAVGSATWWRRRRVP
jgi:hypothetical protein